MKKTIIIFIISYGFSNSYAQDCVVDKIIKQTLEIDSLKRVYQSVRIKNDSLQKFISFNEFSIKQMSLNHQVSDKKNLSIIEELKKEILKLEKYKSEKKSFEAAFIAKRDTIVSFKNSIIQKDNEIKTITDNIKKDYAIERETGKKEVLNQLVAIYKKKTFDELIKSSNIASVQRDKQLIGEITDLKQIIAELETYFNAENLLSSKFNAALVNKALIEITLIKQQSKLIVELNDKLSNFKTFNDGLNTSIQNIIAIDKKEIVKGMSAQVVNSKLNKILSELSKFIFDYNFNFVDYPYFSDIVLDIIKRKRPNPDADIVDLLKKTE